MVFIHIKANAGRWLEALVVVGLVLFFFIILLNVFNYFFPSGTGLDMLLRHDDPAHQAETGQRSLAGGWQVAGSQGEGDLGSASEVAAVLSVVNNTVKYKSLGQMTWQKAEAGLKLKNRDAIQTLAKSQALLRYDTGEKMQVGENSLVIVRKVEQDAIFQHGRHTSLMVLEGELSGQLAGGVADVVELNTPTATAKIQALTGSNQPADYKVKINEDKSSTIAVYSGRAEVTAMGYTVMVEANHAATIAPDQVPQAPYVLPPPPKLMTPDANTVYYYRSLPPRIGFSWKAHGLESRYRLLIARDPKLEDLVLSEDISSLEFVHGNLKAGTYYWTVATMGRMIEGRPAIPQRFTLLRDQQAPQIQVLFPAEPVTATEVTLLGHTEPDAKIYIDGEPVELNEDGSFSFQLRLRRGSNVVVVEAIDNAGNVAYQSHLVQAKF